MLYGVGRADMGGYAASKPLRYPPGEVWAYSTGSTNIICRVLRDVIGGPTQVCVLGRCRMRISAVCVWVPYAYVYRYTYDNQNSFSSRTRMCVHLLRMRVTAIVALLTPCVCLVCR